MRTEFSPFSHELPKSRFSVLIILLCSVCLMLTGCGSKQKAPGTASFRPYTINGRTYYPLRSARGYVQEGRASWYGPGFHGKKTASGEIYKQYGMTAAHTVLPLHTMVRVTNLQNGRSVILRVNDRGPFIDNRVIDVSRAAALRLSMISGGTAWVRIESLEKDRDISSPEKKPASDSRATPSEAPELQDTPSVGKQLSETTGPAAAVTGRFFVQAGAFSRKHLAERLSLRLSRNGLAVHIVATDKGLWRVLAGPWESLNTANDNLWNVRSLCPDAHIVSGTR